MPNFKTLNDIDVTERRVLVRADLNVPMSDGQVTDNSRLSSLVPTLKELVDRRAKICVLSHLGRPGGKVVRDLSLKPVSLALSECLGQPVSFASDCIGSEAKSIVSELDEGEIVVLENLRFYPEEEDNDINFARSLAKHGDLYVNDAFSVSHRAHASTAAIANLLPSAAGRLMELELDSLTNAFMDPKRPLIAIIGGSKISTKIDLLVSLSQKVDSLIIGGGMANTFLNATGVSVGKSLCESDMAATARKIMEAARDNECNIVLPIDAVVSKRLETGSLAQTVDINEIPQDKMVLDVGPKSLMVMSKIIRGGKTVIWNGPIGAFEIKPFDHGTGVLSKLTGDLSIKGNICSIAGGGDTVAALNQSGVTDLFSYVSFAGGAFLEWLEGKTLPGVEVLTR
tara:strand:+ start:29444 stop:30637 length:1194 start_codon:yes stop_codon:yes gene_type:complete